MDISILKDCMCQSEAAALAVLAAHVRETLKKQIEANGAGGAEMSELETEQLAVLKELELCGIASIQQNDGEMTKWLAMAGRQMNPLLS